MVVQGVILFYFSLGTLVQHVVVGGGGLKEYPARKRTLQKQVSNL